MMNTTITARSGLTVTMPQAEFDEICTRRGPVAAKQLVLSDAGRALKHRRELAAFYAQQLSAEDQMLINAVARELIRDAIIHQAARELGYGNYVDRVQMGRSVNDAQWARIIERSLGWAGEIDDTPDDGARSVAAQKLGFLTEHDAEYSRYWTVSDWQITAPNGWDGQPASAAEALS